MPEGDECNDETITVDPSEKIQLAIQKVCHIVPGVIFISNEI